MTELKKERSFLLRQTALHRMVIQYHPEIGQLYVPGINTRIPNELGGYYVRTNSQGFRSDIEFQPQRRDRPRILFFGDSFTAGFGVSNQERFTDLLGRALHAEVYNYGLTGSGTDQQLLIYEKYARNVEADLMIFCVMVENIERNLNSHHRTIDRYNNGQYVYVPKPYFKLENGRLVRYHQPVPLDRRQEEPENFRTEERKVAFIRNRLLHTMRQLYYHPRLDFLRGARQASIVQNDFVAKFLQFSQFQPYSDYLDANTAGWQLMEAILRRFLTRAAPTPVLIIPIPDAFFYRTTPLKPIYQEQFERLHNPERCVYVADVTTPMNQLSPAEKAKMPFQYDFHFSPYGNQRMAEFLLAELEKRNLLARRPRSNGRVIFGSNGRDKSREAQTYILGISCFYHNAAACLIRDGHIVAAAEEERFARIKHDRNFPHRAINYCLEEAGIQHSNLTAVVYYDNAYQTFERLLHTQLAIGAEGQEAWLRVMPSWLQYKLSIPVYIRRSLRYPGTVLHDAHHRSHAASAFYPSPFERATILTIDGVGEWATASISVGRGSEITMLKEMHFPHSVGLLYSAFTQFIGFKVNNGEYKMMGLAPYGEPTYVDLIHKHLVDLKDDGSIELNMEYFAFLSEPRMTNETFANLFGGPPRHPSEPITRREMDMARSIQVVTEEIVMRMAQHAYELTGEQYLCLAGGVALNCVANGRLLREGPFADIWIQPAAGDAGCALGAALDVWHTYLGQPRPAPAAGQSLQGGSYWGPAYTEAEIRAFLDTFGYPYHQIEPDERADKIAHFIESGKVVGHFTGRMEYGPRALGSRSILGDARNPKMQTTLNLKIKYRESFRPFAPSVLAECITEFFELDRESPYMLLVAPVARDRRLPFDKGEEQNLFEIVKQPRSDVPAITHVDHSARIQSVSRASHADYYDVIDAFRQRTGYGIVVNTSFNVRGEPIVCSPYDAYRCFMCTEMDILILGHYLLFKEEQPAWPDAKGHVEAYDPDAAVSACEGPVADTLRQVFVHDFLPLAQRLTANGRLRIPHTLTQAPTTWVLCPAVTSPEEVFTIPAVLNDCQGDIVRMAQAVRQFWQDDEVSAALVPVVEKLLRISNELLALPEDEEAVEVVTDFVYVMY